MNILIIITEVNFSLKTTSLATSSFDMGVKVWVVESENVSSVIKEIGWHLNELNFGWIYSASIRLFMIWTLSQ